MEGLFATPTGTDTLTRFVAHVLFFVAAGSVTVYTVRNARQGTVRSHMWRYLLLAGAVGALYALSAIVETAASAAVIASDPTTVGALRRVCQLFFIVFLALAVRELHSDSPHGSTGVLTDLPLRTVRLIEAGFMVVVVVEFLVVIWLGLVDVARLVQLAASVAFTAYGVSFAVTIKSAAMARRTVLDTMLTYIIAVMLTTGAASAIEVGYVVGVPSAAVESTSIVLTVMSASFLVALTIRLKQNVDSLRY